MKKKNIIYNLLFVCLCVAILVFLLMAPPETTAPLPQDENHLKFMPMKKKTAEKYCGQCHDDNGMVPLPAEHPPKYRCLFCHKKS